MCTGPVADTSRCHMAITSTIWSRATCITRTATIATITDLWARPKALTQRTRNAWCFAVSFVVLCWLFVAAVAIHNLEEAILLPAWSRTAGRWHVPVGASEFRFAVIVLTALAVIAALLASMGGKNTVGAYLIAGYALAMLLNVVFPHLIATIALRRYAPGTGTAVLLNLPTTVLLLHHAFAEGYIDAGTFAWSGPLVVVGLVVLIPVLFLLGRTVAGQPAQG